MVLSPVVINKLRRVIFSDYEPRTKAGILWGKRLNNGSYAFLAYNNGAWRQIASGESGGGGGGGLESISIALNGETYNPDNGIITLPDYPTSLPASDVSDWAKAQNKPSYNYSEIQGTPSIPNEQTVSEWGFTKNGGTVTQIKLGNVAYDPNSGIVSLPAYPTTLPASDVQNWAKAQNKPSYNASEVGALDASLKGANNGVAELDSSGKVPSSQLPSYVDDTVEGYLYDNKFYSDSQHQTEVSGESSKIYVTLDTNKTYRWSGSAFVEISESLALGETSSTAFAGNRGKAIEDKIPSNASSNNKLATMNDIPTVGTAASKNVPSSGNAGNTEVVLGNDSRLSDSRTPKAHTHTVSEINDFPASMPASDVPAWAKQTNPPASDLGVTTHSGMISALTCVVNTYHKILSTVNTLAITLPAVSGGATKSIIVRFTTGSTPNITFASADSKTIKYFNGYNIEANCEYELNILFDGGGWVVAASEIGGQSSSPEVDVATFSGAALTAELNKYYDASTAVGTLAVTLPAVGGSKTKSIMMHLTTTSSPNITFTSADNKTISYYSSYAIEASKEYEISIVFNGTKWIIASAEIATS